MLVCVRVFMYCKNVQFVHKICYSLFMKSDLMTFDLSSMNYVKIFISFCFRVIYEGTGLNGGRECMILFRICLFLWEYSEMLNIYRIVHLYIQIRQT